MGTRILIVGGGIAGLALAQALRKINIDTEVFERDASGDARQQRWSVALTSVVPGLKELLPPDLGPFQALSNNFHLGIKDTGAILNPDGSVKIHIGGELRPMININRLALRRYFEPKVSIHWNKRFVRYEETEGGVTVYFEDGSSAHGTALIGADGAGSKVRHQLFSGTDAQLHRLPYGVIGANSSINKTDWQRLTPDGAGYFACISGGVLLFFGLRDPITESPEVNIVYHMYWVDNSVLDGGYWTQSASREELRDRALKIGAHLPENMRSLLELFLVEDMLPRPFLMNRFAPPDSFPRGRVTLIGDAAHAMTPFFGMGANIAITDALDLGRLFRERTAEGASGIEDLFKRYEALMIPRSRKIVNASCDSLVDDPNGERLPLTLKSILANPHNAGAGPPKGR